MFAALALLAAPVYAGSTKSALVYETITGPEVQTIVSGISGVSGVELGKDDDGDPKVKWQHNNLNVVMYFYGCNAGECNSLQAYAGLGMTNKPTPDKIIQWNKDKRFGRAYLDDDKDPCVEMDLSLIGGVTTASIEVFVNTFHTIKDLFAEYVGFNS